jgi:hypothetical protein
VYESGGPGVKLFINPGTSVGFLVKFADKVPVQNFHPCTGFIMIRESVWHAGI